MYKENVNVIIKYNFSWTVSHTYRWIYPWYGLSLISTHGYIYGYLYTCPSVLDTVGWVIWPVKTVPDMTYNVFGGTLNPTLLLLYPQQPWVHYIITWCRGANRYDRLNGKNWAKLYIIHVHREPQKRAIVFSIITPAFPARFFIIFVPVETERNTLHYTYLMAWWSHTCVILHLTKVYFIFSSQN